MNSESEKLQKSIAACGKASRRQAESWIVQGRVSVNGQIVQVGTRVKQEDIIRIDGHILARAKTKPENRILIYHKQEGEICSKVRENDLETVFAKLPPIKNGRWICVGRMDVNTSGLMLFTNNGELANYLMHPRQQLERVYSVRVLGEVPRSVLKQLSSGVELEDGMAHFETVKSTGGTGANRWYEVVLKEGRKREVRRLWESQGYQVSRLIRIRFGPVSLPRNLRRGQYRHMNREEVRRFLSDCQFKSD